jgi:mannose-6-phosphate isomerase-like protein (cupin superfamily)
MRSEVYRTLSKIEESRGISKGWGKEITVVNNDKYCGKLMHFPYMGGITSMHFHGKKDEIFYVETGTIKLIRIDPDIAKEYEHTIHQGEGVHIPALTIHQLQALENNTIVLEISTTDEDHDLYRVQLGDSQK